MWHIVTTDKEMQGEKKKRGPGIGKLALFSHKPWQVQPEPSKYRRGDLVILLRREDRHPKASITG